MMKPLFLLFCLLLLFSLSSCAKANKELINRDMELYSAMEEEINSEINRINDYMKAVVAETKKSGDMEKLKKERGVIAKAVVKLHADSKAAGRNIESSEFKQYHKLTLKLLDLQWAAAQNILNSYMNKGEYGGSARKADIKYRRKIRDLKKRQERRLQRIAEILNEDKNNK